MTESQIENTEDKISRTKENKSRYNQKRYISNLEEMRKVRRDYYYANKEKILEKAKQSRTEKTGGRSVGRPKKYTEDV